MKEDEEDIETYETTKSDPVEDHAEVLNILKKKGIEIDDHI